MKLYYYNPKFSIWLSVDPLAEKYYDVSAYTYTLNNPINYVDPDGRENIPALLWAARNMANKNIPFSEWYGFNGGWKYQKGVVPTETVCYESCWTSYMNGANSSTMNVLKSGFSANNGAFKGRSHDTGGMNWFKKGDGTDRQFVSNIAKGELGDIVFMGEVGDMQGHAVLLASEVVYGCTEIDGIEVNTMYFKALTISSESDSEGGYGSRQFTFTQQENGEWQADYHSYTFRGYGQMTNIESTEADRIEATNLINQIENGK
ncbi:RHS repeat-associated core domain-containing protein [Nonlabens ulvanivorans]|uniref:RHS repeat-associated core domain-containing protein n=1 Tax=Nonlabens ulvanivorans TaxID=906888 RepID=UPI00294394E2|nr:RHS repeat-associated core domain-containing protein [Nonlabens ulvanivorans]WOI21615.1 RHS repeat-associated core domain-containing protein [Nonlabens ulvanivorans]